MLWSIRQLLGRQYFGVRGRSEYEAERQVERSINDTQIPTMYMPQGSGIVDRRQRADIARVPCRIKNRFRSQLCLQTCVSSGYTWTRGGVYRSIDSPTSDM